MPGTPHEVVLLAIRENPELFAELLRRVVGTDMPGPIEVMDSNVRFAASLETRPDLVLRTPNAASKWTIIELQNRKDESKWRSWPLAVSVLLQRDGMGDVVVITASRSVATWAKGAAHHRGERGTSLGLTPVILLLSQDHASALLDPARPELAIFAVWAGLPRPWTLRPPRREARHGAGRGDACPVAGSPGACDPGNVEPAAPGIAQGDGDGC